MKRLAEAVGRDPEFLAALIDTSPDGILVVDPEGRMISFNRRFVAMWGIPPDIARSRSDERALQSVLDKLADPDGFLARVRHLYEHPEETSLEDIALNDGRVFERHSFPLVDAAKRYHGRVWYFRDITERQRTRAELTRRTEELELFVTAASHDLRNPLTAIEGFGALLAKAAAGADPSADAHALRLRAAAQRLRHLIDSLLRYARVDAQSSPAEPVDLNAAVQEALRLLDYAVRVTGARVETAPLPVVSAHRPLMVQLFLNLIDNALKFRVPGTPPRVTVEAARRGTLAAVSVRDNGIGFTPEQARQILRPFTRLNPSDRYEGSGLGLALCAHIARRYGGRLDAESPPGGGAVFTVHLPL